MIKDAVINAFNRFYEEALQKRWIKKKLSWAHVRRAYAKCSNEDGSHLSSIGKCLIAERYEGRYGVAYRLDGLEESNSALRERCVVLHGWQYTTSFPIYPFPTVGSWGCPVLSRRAMRKVDEILRREERVVLWLYK